MQNAASGLLFTRAMHEKVPFQSYALLRWQSNVTALPSLDTMGLYAISVCAVVTDCANVNSIPNHSITSQLSVGCIPVYRIVFVVAPFECPAFCTDIAEEIANMHEHALSSGAGRHLVYRNIIAEKKQQGEHNEQA